MAGERKGKVYESVVYSVLTDLCTAGRLRGGIFWNVTPRGMSIEPDFTVGTTADNPRYGLLVTHCSSRKNSDMKGWRNLGELAEFKSTLPSIPVVCAITFGSIKEDIAPLQHAAFDGFRWVTPREPDRCSSPQPWLVVASWAAELDDYVDRLQPEMPDKDERQNWIVDAIRNLSRTDRKAIGYDMLRDLISVMFAQSNRAMARLWTVHRELNVSSAPAGRRTSVRNGLSKALLFPDPVAAVEAAKTDRPLGPANFSALLLEHGLVRRFSAGGRELNKVTDQEIKGLAQTVSQRQLQHLVQVYRSQGARWFNQVSTTSALPAMLSLLRKRWISLQDPSVVFSLIRDAHHGVVGGIKVDYTWPFYRLFDAIKLGTGRIQGYGLAQLLVDIRETRRSPSYARRVASVAGVSPESVNMRAPRSIERLISVQVGDWHSKGSAALFQRYPTDMAEVAIALAARLRKTDETVLDNPDGFLKAIFQSNITNGFAVWRLYEPLKELIDSAAPACSTVAFRSCYAERAGEDVREDSGEIQLIQAGRTLINWQSCTDSGRDHKKKELCGRAVALRYHWNGKHFIARPGIEKLILLLDGSWRDADLKALMRAGWDEIFYPDEMDRLVKAIV